MLRKETCCCFTHTIQLKLCFRLVLPGELRLSYELSLGLPKLPILHSCWQNVLIYESGKAQLLKYYTCSSTKHLGKMDFNLTIWQNKIADFAAMVLKREKPLLRLCITDSVKGYIEVLFHIELKQTYSG